MHNTHGYKYCKKLVSESVWKKRPHIMENLVTFYSLPLIIYFVFWTILIEDMDNLIVK